MAVLKSIELSTSSLPRQGMAFIKAKNIEGLNHHLAGHLPLTHAMANLCGVPDSGFSY
jgi:hypothetical protein